MLAITRPHRKKGCLVLPPVLPALLPLPFSLSSRLPYNRVLTHSTHTTTAPGEYIPFAVHHHQTQVTAFTIICHALIDLERQRAVRFLARVRHDFSTFQLFFGEFSIEISVASPRAIIFDFVHNDALFIHHSPSQLRILIYHKLTQRALCRIHITTPQPRGSLEKTPSRYGEPIIHAFFELRITRSPWSVAQWLLRLAIELDP